MDPLYLRKIFSYHPCDGTLHWKERPREHFAREQDWLRWNKIFPGHEALNCPSSTGYFKGKIDGKTYLKHRVIWAMIYGYWPTNVDHEDGHPSHNAFFNLNDVSDQQNSRNRSVPANNTSGHMGVTYVSRQNQYRAWITDLAGKQKHLGSFPTLEAAIQARQTAEKKLGYHPNHGRCS